jgi:serine protease inhibitor
MSDAPDNDYGLGLKVHEDAYRELEDELAAVTEQRDMLEEALELLVTTDHESKEAFIERVKQALAAVKGGCDDN